MLFCERSERGRYNFDCAFHNGDSFIDHFLSIWLENKEGSATGSEDWSDLRRRKRSFYPWRYNPQYKDAMEAFDVGILP